MTTETAIEILEPEVVTQQLAEVEKSAGLAEDAAVALRGEFADYYNAIVEWQEKALLVTKPDDATHQKIAREVRLGMRRVRCDMENTRKAMNAESLARNRFINGVNGILKIECNKIEDKMLEVEQYAARQEEARLAAVSAERTTAIVAEGGDPAAYNLGLMDDETFDALLAGIKVQRERREEAERKVEADRIAAEKAEAEEQERMRVENERLKKEAEEHEAAAEKERAKVEAERAKEREVAEKREKAIAEAAARDMKIQREARKKAEAKAEAEREQAEEKQRELEAEAKVEREAKEKAEDAVLKAKVKEQHRIREEKAAKKKAAQAPDKEKLVELSGTILDVELPKMTSPEGHDIMIEISQKRDGFATWIEQQAEAL